MRGVLVEVCVRFVSIRSVGEPVTRIGDRANEAAHHELGRKRAVVEYKPGHNGYAGSVR